MVQRGPSGFGSRSVIMHRARSWPDPSSVPVPRWCRLVRPGCKCGCCRLPCPPIPAVGQFTPQSDGSQSGLSSVRLGSGDGFISALKGASLIRIRHIMELNSMTLDPLIRARPCSANGQAIRKSLDRRIRKFIYPNLLWKNSEVDWRLCHLPTFQLFPIHTHCPGAGSIDAGPRAWRCMAEPSVARNGFRPSARIQPE